MAADLGGVAFEQSVAQRLGSLGWCVVTTPVTGDFGADLLAKSALETAVVQCKDYGSPVGIDAVQEVFLAKAYYSALLAIVVARNGFTQAARCAAQRASVLLMRPDEIVPGCVLDRSIERRRREEQQAADRARAEALRKEEEARQRRARVEAQQRDAAARAQAEASRKEAQELQRSARAAASQREKDRHISCLWRQYDVNVKRFQHLEIARQASASFIFRSAFVLIISMPLLPREAALAGGTVASALTVALAMLRRFRADAPEPPFASRQGAILSCNICRTRLCAEYGKDVAVPCPHCGAITDAKT